MELSSAPFLGQGKRLYEPCRGNPAMAINGRCNKPIGPGGGTRRLHQKPAAFEDEGRLLMGAK